jgi:hypothetical protein
MMVEEERKEGEVDVSCREEERRRRRRRNVRRHNKMVDG